MNEFFIKFLNAANFFREKRMPHFSEVPPPAPAQRLVLGGKMKLPPEVEARIAAAKSKKEMQDRFSSLLSSEMLQPKKSPEERKPGKGAEKTDETTPIPGVETPPQEERAEQVGPVAQLEREVAQTAETRQETANTPAPTPEKTAKPTTEQLLDKMSAPLKPITKTEQIVTTGDGALRQTSKLTVFSIQPSTEFLKLLPENGGTLRISLQMAQDIRDELMYKASAIDAVFNPKGKMTTEFSQFMAQLFKTMVLMRNRGERYGNLLSQISDGAETVATKTSTIKEGQANAEPVTEKEREDAKLALRTALQSASATGTSYASGGPNPPPPEK